MTIGSLFDGSGGFPLAFAMCGGEPVWRSEVEPYPIRVTRSRFPGMMHLGDVQKVNGAKIKPVDVMTFGSPCQDLSVAGKRAGLKHTENGDEETTRSGLFMEPIRIIKEMRYATDGLYPTFAVWENVPGAFSSNKGEDFRVVLEELARIKGGKITIPKPDKWRKAGCIEGDGWSIAWRTVDAQHWGVAQRRKRIYLVADFRGQRAAEILFEREGLRGYFEKGGKTWQTAAACAETGTGADDKCIAYAFEPGAASRLGGYVNENITGTLRAEMGDNQVAVVYGIQRQLSGVEVHKDLAPTILAAAGESGNNKPLVAYGVDCWNQCMTGDKTARIRASAQDNDHIPCVMQIESHPMDSRVNIDESGKCQTLTGRMGTGGGNVPMVMHYGFPLGFRPENVKLYEECATTLCNGTRAGFTTGVVYAVDQGGGKSSATVAEDMAPTLTCTHDGAPAVCYWDGGQVTGTLTANNAGGNQRMPDKENFNCVIDRHYIVRRLTPTECARLQGFPDRWGHPDKKESLTDEEYLFWLDVRNTHARINGKAEREYSKAQMTKWYNRLHSDGAEYKMWGNGIALPNALYVMQGIAKRLKKGAEDGKQRID